MTRNGFNTMRNRVDRVLIESDNSRIERFDCGTQSTLIHFHYKTRELRARNTNNPPPIVQLVIDGN